MPRRVQLASEKVSLDRRQLFARVARHSGELKNLLEQIDQIDTQSTNLVNSFQINENHSSPYDTEFSAYDLIHLAKGLYKSRRRRENYFSFDIFGEPAWDMLIDMYIQKAGGKKVAVSDACIASSVPPTTGLRWITILEHQNLIVRIQDENDKRRVFLELSDQAYQKIERLLCDILTYIVSGRSR